MIKEFFEDEPVLFWIITLFISLLIFFLIDGIWSQAEFYKGNVIDKHYQARSHRTGTGVGVTSGGGTAVVVTTESEPEKFLIMVKSYSGKIVTVKCNPELYYEKNIGDDMDYKSLNGLFTGIAYSWRGVR